MIDFFDGEIRMKCLVFFVTGACVDDYLERFLTLLPLRLLLNSFKLLIDDIPKGGESYILFCC